METRVGIAIDDRWTESFGNDLNELTGYQEMSTTQVYFNSCLYNTQTYTHKRNRYTYDKFKDSNIGTKQREL